MEFQILRILHVVQGMNRGGIETMIMNIYRCINRNEVQFDFLLSCKEKSDYEDEILSLGGKIFRMSPISIINPNKYLKDVNSFFKENKNYKIVHSHMNAVSLLPLYVAKINHIPVRISHSHISYSGKGLKGTLKNTIRHPLRRIATHYFACSKDAAIFLFGNGFFKKQNSFILKNAICAELYIYNSKVRSDLRHKYNVEKKTVYGHIGRFNYQKNHTFILDIFKIIHGRNPDSVLMLVGDGELRLQIEEKIFMLGLVDSVILTGVVSNVYDYLQAMDVFLFPSLFEGLGMGLIEAQSAGLKCFASDTTPIESAITDLVTYISLSEKAEKWADKIMNIEKNYKRENMLSIIQSTGYDVKTTSNWLEEFYKKL